MVVGALEGVSAADVERRRLAAEAGPALVDMTGLAALGQSQGGGGSRVCGRQPVRDATLATALSVFTPRGSRWERPREVVRNPLLADEARRMKRLYARTGFSPVASSR